MLSLLEATMSVINVPVIDAELYSINNLLNVFIHQQLSDVLSVLHVDPQVEWKLLVLPYKHSKTRHMEHEICIHINEYFRTPV